MDDIPPCFLRGTFLRSINNEYIPIEELKKGDPVIVRYGKVGTIKNIFKIPVYTSISCPLSPDLVVSHTQPVRRIMQRVSRKTHPWRIAGELKHIGRNIGTDGWLIVLEDGEGMVQAREWECTTIGHGIAHDPIIAHPYWGTQRAVKDLEYRYIQTH